ncbi:diphosphomevalonate/mevalonate 3,5-bisphosphate decarboxylase family protein, partial [Streptosporangium algeriense]
ACRSLFGGFVHWHAGTGTGQQGDASSFAEPVPVGAVDPAMVIALVDAAPKAMPSRSAMRHTMATSPLYRAWAEACHADLRQMRDALARGDLRAVGVIAERNALGMHATMLAAQPAVRYLSAGSLAVLDRVTRLREDGVLAYATLDAGPNVVVLCARSNALDVAAALDVLGEVRSVHIAGPGPGAAVVGGERR